MIGGYYAEGQIAKEAMLCKPDPEEMLQSARKHAEQIDEAIAHFVALIESPISFSRGPDDREILAIFGHLHLQKYEADKRIEYCLKEIDKE